jgi:hypothetical protein
MQCVGRAPNCEALHHAYALIHRVRDNEHGRAFLRRLHRHLCGVRATPEPDNIDGAGEFGGESRGTFRNRAAIHAR